MKAIGELRSSFISSLNACERIWGAKAFYKPQGTGWRSQFISPLYDAEMVAASQFSDTQLERIVKNREKAQRTLMSEYNKDALFARSITQATNNPSNVKKRIETVVKVMRASI